MNRASILRAAVAVSSVSLLGGCLFAPPKFGARGIVTPESEQYGQYLSFCKNLSKPLAARCQEWGDPAAIKIGNSGGYFVWCEPPTLMKVGAFGRSSETTHIPSDLRFRIDLPQRPAAPAIATVSPSAPVSGKTSSGVAYTVERFERLKDDEFAYAFKIVFKDADAVGLSSAQRVKRELRNNIEEDYRAAVSEARNESVQVDFTEFSMKNGIVEGCASVTRIAVTGLKYDDVTQKGVISVRIGASSFEKARAWVRKNIETIVRDKNIALTTGSVPSDKHFFLGNERVLPGNILQLEFEAQ